MTIGNRIEFFKLAFARRRFVLLIIVFVFGANSQAQEKLYFSKGNAPPGLTAQQKLLENPRLASHTQPVHILTPNGSLISMWSSQGFTVAHESSIHVGLAIGRVYRMKVANIPRFRDYEVYPSVEILDRLNPPEGMENQFPIKIVITADDLEKALRGELVTKVIYLEDPKMSLPYRRNEDDQPYFDIGPAEDVLRTAERLGRPMAIVRIGSRVPTIDDMNTQGEFDFFSEPPVELPAPQPMNPDAELSGPEVGDLVPRKPERNLPPIVPGDDFRRVQIPAADKLNQ